MKEKMIYGLLALFFIALAWMPTLYAEENFQEVVSQVNDEGSDPSDFEGDSGNMPGERAPENMPMDDAPVDAGVGIQ